MKLIRSEIQKSQRFKKSHSTYHSSSHNSFTPFHHQRDSMNRLISMKSSSLNKQTKTQESNVEQNVIKVQKNKPSLRKFNQFFKQQNVFLESQPKKHSIKKKTLIQLLTQPNAKQRPFTSHKSNVKTNQLVSQPSFDNFQYKTQSAQLNRTSYQKIMTIKRTKSTIIPKDSQGFTSKKSVSPESSPKKMSYYQPKVNVQENLNKYPELNRVRKMQQLHVKLHPDFEQKHDLFMDKMIKSKQLAFEVKANLEKIDNIYF